MLIISLLFHLVIFSAVFFVPESMPTRRISGPIYQVNLVEMPSLTRLKGEGGERAKTGKVVKLVPGPKRTAPAKQISVRKKEKKPVVIAKRTITTKTKRIEKPKVSSSKLLDEALSKIKRKAGAEKKREEVDPLKEAISKLEGKVRGGAGEEAAGSGAPAGITIRIYQMEVEERIKGNWSYAVGLAGPKKEKGLEAVIVLKARSNGTIIKSWFKKRSSNAMFDQSVLRAVERSDPLPPFPEGYRKTTDEIEITFNLKDLEE
ncbi:MAG: TonB family protein [Desulfobacteraceae bacterium]|nr:TonB family protein [Desulfobacteraceae bacterium]